ncbi:MAG: trypsin-like peptidase domain-containing protein [Ruminococcus sp.]|nr:trypsin-like peptidase domain-containing protein [Ruminococcus sp.]
MEERDTNLGQMNEPSEAPPLAPAAPETEVTESIAPPPVQPTAPIESTESTVPPQQSAPSVSPYAPPPTPSAPVTPQQQGIAPQSAPMGNSYNNVQSGTAVPPPQTPRRPVYDKFMYEPIGFEGYDRREHIPPPPPEPPQFSEMAELFAEPEKKPVENETVGLKLVAALIASCIIIGIIGIAYDVANSKKALSNFKSSGNVVLYSEKKPENAKDTESYKDENGRYTTEGIAELVRPSIVEIYTYSDPAHRDLLGTGSGVVLSDEGYIVTNAHVLESDGYHTIKTIDGDSYSAKIVGRDVKTDIAVVSVNAKGLVPAVLGDSDESVVGEQVVAIGNPANLSSTVTDGIISAVNRKIRSDSTGFEMDCIQTNADISPGNSGGALVNMYGQVIGITSSKYVSSSFEGLGFAITINEAKPIIEELINNGFIGGRFRIGISLLDMSTATKRTMIEDAIGEKLPENFKGVYISKIDKECDIANTELKEGDFITEIDGTPVSTYDELYNTISASHGAGDTVKATCAHLSEGKPSYYKIEFKLMEDTSGNY